MSDPSAAALRMWGARLTTIKNAVRLVAMTSALLDRHLHTGVKTRRRVVTSTSTRRSADAGAFSWFDG